MNKQIRFTLEEKKIICRFVKECIGGADYDGFLGTRSVPEEIMVVYRKLYPEEWD